MSEAVEWPEDWHVTIRLAGSARIRVGVEDFELWCSGGNEQKWYVDQLWLEDEDPDTSIIGQCETREEAIEYLKTWLQGGYVPSGDEVVVRVGEKSTGYLPIFHNHDGAQYVQLPEVI